MVQAAVLAGTRRVPRIGPLLALTLVWLLAGCAVSAPRLEALAVTEVAPGVYVHEGAIEDWLPANGGDVANLGFVVGERCVAVIDSGGTPRVGQRLRLSVQRATPLPVCYVINTHAHPDHVLGDTAFADATPTPEFVASARYAATLAAREPYYRNALQRDFGIALGHEGIVYPTRGVASTLELDLGGRSLLLTAWPTAHTDNDITVLDRRTRTLFTSDLLFVSHLPVLDGALRGWLAVMAELQRQDVATVVPGHGPVGRDLAALLEPQHRYLEALLRDVRKAIADGWTIQQTVDRLATAPSGWLLTDRFHRRNLTAAYAELEWEN